MLPSEAVSGTSRAAVLEQTGLTGRAFCRALSDATDGWLRELFATATGGRTEGLALLAVGGYGRGELAPGSDLDLWLLHDDRSDVAAVAERLWYPIWDAGPKLGHAVRTPRQALALIDEDLDTATAALSARFLAGDAAVGDDLAERAHDRSSRRAGRWLVELSERVADRHATAGEVAFLLEPDVKEGRGGLRDVHALRWAEAARPVLLPGDSDAVTEAEDTLLAVRVELHRLPGRASDLLLLERQDDVAAALGLTDADALMAHVATAARTISWTSDEVWSRINSRPRPLGLAHRRGSKPGIRIALRGSARHRERVVGPGLVFRDGEIHLDEHASPATDPGIVLRAGAAAAAYGGRLDRASLDRLAAEVPDFGARWPEGARDVLVQLLGEGRAALPVLEALDQRRLVERFLPEWTHTRSRPQRNALHRFTVDRHMFETAANAAALVNRVERPDLLLVGAWLHDIGKGLPGDHTEVGVVLIADITRRMGFPPDDVDVLVSLVRHHLLLPDVATRRDLSDDDVIRGVADAVGSPAKLQLLAALTEADSIATGPSAWGPWKAELMAQLVERTAHVLGGGQAADLAGDRFPGAEVISLLEAGATVVRGEGTVLTVVAPDRPGLFSRIAGGLTLSGVTVLAADAASTDDGMAASQFRRGRRVGGRRLGRRHPHGPTGHRRPPRRRGPAGRAVPGLPPVVGRPPPGRRPRGAHRQRGVGHLDRDRGQGPRPGGRALPHHPRPRRPRPRHPPGQGLDPGLRGARCVLRPHHVGGQGGGP